MLNILNSIKSVIASSIKVEVKAPIMRSGKTRYPVLVTDASQSFTSGWYVQYSPSAQDNGTRLYDGAESFSELVIARFSEIQNLILTGNYYFLNGQGVEVLSGGRSRAIYEPSDKVRLTITSQPNSVYAVITITDEQSPFYMMSIPFTVTNHNNTPYIVGSDKLWDRNTDTFTETNANFAPRKGRFYRVQQQQNSPATLRAKIAVNNGQYAINQDGTFQIDTQAASPEYIQVISNEFKALAYIYEQTLMKASFELAIAQGLPTATNAPAYANNPTQNNPGGFVPSFSFNGPPGQPMPSPQQTTAPDFQIPLSQTAPMQTQQQPNFTNPPVQQQQQHPAFPVQQTQNQSYVQTPTTQGGQATESDLPWST